MAVPSGSSRNVSIAAAGAYLFPYSFKVSNKSDLAVEVDGVAKTVDVDFVASGIGADAGGDITFTTPLTGGETVVRYRNMVYKRETDYQNLGDLRSSTLNNDQDDPVMMIQQLAESVDRAVKLPKSTTGDGQIDVLTPLAPLVVNAAGDGIEVGDTTLSGDLLLRPSLAAPDGSSLVGFQQSGTSAASQTLLSKVQGTLDVMDFVAVADKAGVLSGAIDASAAFQAALNESITRGNWKVMIPAGTFRLNTTLTVALLGGSSFNLEGAGMGLTQLVSYDASGNCLSISRPAGNWWLNVPGASRGSIRIANLSVCATLLNTGKGIYINGGTLEGRPAAPTVFEDVEIRALNSIDGQAFSTGLHLNDCGQFYAVHCRFLCGGVSNLTPIAVDISATDATTDPTGFFFTSCEWTYGGKGIRCASNPEGIYLTQCSMIAMAIGVEWICAAESGLHVIGGHYNNKSYNFYLSGVYDFVIANALCYLQGGSPVAHIYTVAGQNININGNIFFNGPLGVDMGASPAGTNRGGVIANNQFSSMTTAAIRLNAGTTYTMVGQNNYVNCAARVQGSGGSNTYIQPRVFAYSGTVSLAGGAVSETINIPVPAGVFDAAPSSVVISMESSTTRFHAQYARAGASTATNIEASVFRNDGGTIPAQTVRYNVVAGL